MILSMTGYGRGEARDGDISYSVEIKSLNSKSTDIRCKMPDGFIQEEIWIRKIVQDQVMRGRIEVIVTDKSQGDALTLDLDDGLIKAYHSKLKALSEELGEDSSDLIPVIMRNQELLKGQTQPISDEQWAVVKKALDQSIANLNEFRQTEGKVLSDELSLRAKNIGELLPKVALYEGARIEKLKERLHKNLEEFIQKDKVDQNRFEQEVLFYIEKLDITEEKIRLDQHCKYFEEQIQAAADQSGKVLNFICQEMGREINTLGAKAQNSDLQQIVVSMKDELEKIKEQLANVL